MSGNNIGYEYYFNTYNCGHPGTLTQAEFDKYISFAQRELAAVCCLENLEGDTLDAVMLCACEVAELIFKTEKKNSVKSETIDGYSVTFSEDEDFAHKLRKTVLKRLSWTGLLYAGVE